MHLDGDGVPARTHQVGDVELRGRVAALVVPDVLPVDPHEVAGGHRLEAQERTPAGPVPRDLERAYVRAGGIHVVRHAGRVVRPHLGRDVPEHRVVEVVALPGVRHGHGPPAGHVVPRLLEPARHFLGAHGQRELPLPVQRPRPRGLLDPAPGGLAVGVRPEHRVRCLLALPDHLRVLQVLVHVSRRLGFWLGAGGHGDPGHRQRGEHHPGDPAHSTVTHSPPSHKRKHAYT